MLTGALMTYWGVPVPPAGREGLDQDVRAAVAALEVDRGVVAIDPEGVVAFAEGVDRVAVADAEIAAGRQDRVEIERVFWGDVQDLPGWFGSGDR